MIVYITTNLINSKRYVGRDMYNNPRYLGSGKLLNKAIKKYGRENFKKEILQTCLTIDELKLAEEYWIKYYDAANNTKFYNILDSSTGGDSLSHHPDLENIKTKIRTARKKQKINHSDETKKKIGDAQRGQKGYWYKREKSTEIKEKVSATLKGKPKKIVTCPHCNKFGGEPQMKRWHFDNCSTYTGIKHKPTNKVIWNKGKRNPYSDETLKKMSDSHKNQIPWNKGKKLL
jgi:group I intron endonuclease